MTCVHSEMQTVPPKTSPLNRGDTSNGVEGTHLKVGERGIVHLALHMATSHKLVLALLLLPLACTCVRAQQEAQYTQFMFNKLAFNPAVAGVPEVGLLRVSGRQQWLGFDGGPTSQTANLNLPFGRTGTGLGVRLQRQTIGLEEQFGVEGSYAYRFSLGRGVRMGLGLSAAARQYAVNYADARPVQRGGDLAIPAGNAGKIVPNFGAGIYVDAPGFYLGLGVPRLLRNNLDLGEEEVIIAREARHFYFLGGFKVYPSEKIALEPQMLAKYVIGAPFDADFNLTAYFGDHVFLGGSYRLGGNGVGESASALAGLMLGRRLDLAFAYDLGLSDLNFAHEGSVEATLTYHFGDRGAGSGSVVDPRDQLDR